MLFNSPVFLFLFLPVAVLVYYLLNTRRLVYPAKIWLVVASFFFYGNWNPVYLVLITASIAINYAIGRGLHFSKRNNTVPDNTLSHRKTILAGGIVFNIGLLGYFKYADFFIADINLLSGADIQQLNVVLPLAISFFTFQQIAYLVDCYQTGTQEYRPVMETAESMYRKGHEWPNAYHRRWSRERDGSGNLIPPADTPEDLRPLWGTVTDFQRCLIRATAFLRAMLEGAAGLPANRRFIYYHPALRIDPEGHLDALAHFLEIRPEDFHLAAKLVKPEHPEPTAQMIQEFDAIAPILGLDKSMALAEQLLYSVQA